ncbi:glycosyltransferase family 2 protein [Acinetobacter guillouiae]|jgi:GT2 family glycosyltransferase|uniref:glycosyltransferase family 2 protein n=1 Tax=Acinetobacter guillouiae TaxID=106649 RepID=UPI0028D4D3C0|nr:glycosyltransferase family 2 protein [Acinetobacter guillouiae]
MIAASIVLYKHSYEDLKDTLNCLIENKHINKVFLIDNDFSEWASNQPNEKIHYIKSSGNIGFGSAHNIAIKKYASSYDFFLICNPDIYFDQDQFNNFIIFASTNHAGLYLPKIIYPDGSNQYGARLIPSVFNLFLRRFSPKIAENLDKKYLLKEYNIKQPCFIPYLSGCFMLFNSQALIALNGFDERFFMYMEDVDISRRCAENFGNLYYPQAFIIHKHEQGSYKNKILLNAHLRSALQYFNKWGWLVDISRIKLNLKCLKILRSNI